MPHNLPRKLDERRQRSEIGHWTADIGHLQKHTCPIRNKHLPTLEMKMNNNNRTDE